MKTLSLIKKLLNKSENKSSPSYTSQVTECNSYSYQKTDDRTLLMRWMCKIHSPAMILISITSLTGLISHRFYNQPELAVGTIAPTRIVATKDGSFVDHKSTQEKLKEIRNGSLKVYQEDLNISQDLKVSIQTQLEKIDTLRELKQNLNYISSQILSTSVQEDLYSLPEIEWQKILSEFNSPKQEDASVTKDEKRRQLLNYQKKSDQEEFQLFLKQLQSNREEYQAVQKRISKNKIDYLNETQLEIVLNLDQKTWENIKSEILKSQNLILTQGIYEQFSHEVKYNTATLHLKGNFDQSLTEIGVKLLTPHLKSNLVIDKEKSLQQLRKAEQNVDPIVIFAKKDEVIVNEGETISQEDFVLLDNLGLSRRGISFTGVAASGALVSISIVLFMTIANKIKKKIRRRDQILLWLLTLSVPVINLFNVNYNSLPAVGFLTSTFYGPTLAVTQVVILTSLSLFQTNMVGWGYLIPSITAGLVASLIASRLHSREELAFLGVGIGLTQGSLYFIVALLSNSTVGLIWYGILPTAIGYGTLGLSYTIMALGISPYLERFFDLITPIRLAELSNPNRPLLKRLATEAPGTFQHTVFVAGLAEAAARRLHCNVELVRAGTLYHDIGKMHDPLGFIENQMGGPNKHDQINDPWESADIIKKHVSKGLVMAKKCGLPQAIRDFIPQHQGTLLVSYFYYQAQKLAEEDPKLIINEYDFRYDGPIPQSRETGIVMLADGCEAALRSLKGATPKQAIAMIHKIFKARWRDHQLDDSGIKYEELPIIAEVFVNVWQQFNHQRISYPKGALELKPRQSNPELTI